MRLAAGASAGGTAARRRGETELVRPRAIARPARGRGTRRTLTNLYNERPTWLKLAHEKLDRAVLAAYGWDESWAAVWTDAGAGTPLPPGHALEARRREVEALVLAELLRLNGERAQPAAAAAKNRP